jgi:hypothetical protein
MVQTTVGNPFVTDTRIAGMEARPAETRESWAPRLCVGPAPTACTELSDQDDGPLRTSRMAHVARVRSHLCSIRRLSRRQAHPWHGSSRQREDKLLARSSATCNVLRPPACSICSRQLNPLARMIRSGGAARTAGVGTTQDRPRHDLWTKLRDAISHYAPVLIAPLSIPNSRCRLQKK